MLIVKCSTFLRLHTTPTSFSEGQGQGGKSQTASSSSADHGKSRPLTMCAGGPVLLLTLSFPMLQLTLGAPCEPTPSHLHPSNLCRLEIPRRGPCSPAVPSALGGTEQGERNLGSMNGSGLCRQKHVGSQAPRARSGRKQC